ncbi:protein jagunal isoform X2 [Hyalella azteca]|uniref:Protein jagunal isoform X2 n=1 Tax=Hyalella azteca TaxID=294128 RepID=A0A8B7P7S0_HYAAZ|nr:protein jagunal isoform X2 [Hyalella azteca]
MASKRGPTVEGTDGTDFVHRERVATHYQISEWTLKKPVSPHVLNKSRLRKCIFCHLLLALLMLTKLMPDIFDRLDIFILEIEELEVPVPHKWEYIWLLGSIASFLGLSAIKKNRSILLQVYFVLINLLSTVPVLLATMINFSEFWTFCTADDVDKVAMWQGYPVSGLWYIFLLLAMQVHVFTLLFAWRLIVVWKDRSTKKQQ